MYFLVQITIKNDGSVAQGTSRFETMKEAVTQFHVAMASAMTKEDISKFTCIILNESGLPQKTEVYEVPAGLEADGIEPNEVE